MRCIGVHFFYDVLVIFYICGVWGYCENGILFFVRRKIFYPKGARLECRCTGARQLVGAALPAEPSRRREGSSARRPVQSFFSLILNNIQNCFIYESPTKAKMAVCGIRVPGVYFERYEDSEEIEWAMVGQCCV